MDSTTFSSILSSTTEYFDLELFKENVLWIVIVAFLVAFALSMAVGSNDVSNSFGTSVGSKVLTMRQAFMLATVCELAGSALLGAKVSDTIRKGIIDLDMYKGEQKLHMLGNIAALGGSGIWQFVATYINMPVSGSHSTVGAVAGFSLVNHGIHSIKLMELVKIVISWFVSPILSGAVSVAIFWPIRRFVLQRNDPIKHGLRSIPIFFGVTFFINVLSVTLDGPEFFKVRLANHAWFEHVYNATVPILLGLIVGALVYYFLMPKLTKTIQDELNPVTSTPVGVIDIVEQSKTKSDHPNGVVTISQALETQETGIDNQSFVQEKGQKNLDGPATLEVIPLDNLDTETDTKRTIISVNGDAAQLESDERPGIFRLFFYLQILSSIFGSFAHGGNDVSNAMGPLIAIWIVYSEGSVEQRGEVPVWILVFGGIGITVGLWIWGSRVMKTIGQDLTKITPVSGFTIELGAALTVLIASKVGVPVSTTHCKVGSVVAVGHVRNTTGAKAVDWSLFRNIILSWVVTVPASAGLSALLMVILRQIAL